MNGYSVFDTNIKLITEALGNVRDASRNSLLAVFTNPPPLNLSLICCTAEMNMSPCREDTHVSHGQGRFAKASGSRGAQGGENVDFLVSQAGHSQAFFVLCC